MDLFSANIDAELEQKKQSDLEGELLIGARKSTS